MTDKDEDKVIELAQKNIERMYGKGTIIRLDDSPPEDRPAISTGSLKLDRALDIGGFPTDGVVEVYGPESVGKTTLALSAMANAPDDGRSFLFVDVEHSLDPNYATALGVDKKRIMITQPSYGEQAFQIMYEMIKTGRFSIVVLDSVAAMVPKDELEGNFEDKFMANLPRLISTAMKKIHPAAKENNTLVICLNQIRYKVGIVYGDPEVTPGGKALDFWSLQRIDLRIRDKVKDDEGEIIGHKIEAKVRKNKTGTPLRKTDYELIFGKGINQFAEIVELGVRYEFIKETSKGRYEYKDQKIHGRKNLIEFFASDLDEFDTLKKEIENC